jgi:iron complex outermembrane receptor protein
LLSSIPINTVERIEIIRGGSSVLYGDGATGGVIHIITKRGTLKGVHGSVTAEFGQNNHRAGRASVMMGKDGFSLDAHVSKMKTDNFRDHNAVTQENFSGGMQWASKDGRAGLRVDAARQDSQMPGPLTLAQFNANPRQVQPLYANDYVNTDTNRVTAFVERRIGGWEAVADVSYRKKKAQSLFYGFTAGNSSSHQTQFSPRLRNVSASGGFNNEFVTGLDFTKWSRIVEDSNPSYANAAQKSWAVYARDEVKWGGLRLALGARHEVFDKDSAGFDWRGSNAYSAKHSLNAWELQGSYAVSPLLSLFAKSGQSYRVANADDNAYTPYMNTPLKPQVSHDYELGGSMGSVGRRLSVKLFQHRLRDEIFFDPVFFNNVNLDPTRRQGVEVEASARIATAWMLSANWRHVSAKFSDGPNDGRGIPLVPKNAVSVRLNWQPAGGQNASIGVQWVDAQRFDNDSDNTSPRKIPSYLTIDARYAKKFGPWEFAISGENLTNKRYYSYAIKSLNNLNFNVYPDAGRQLKLSARYDF